MADGTVEAIKVKLELQTGNIGAGVKAASDELDKLGDRARPVKLIVSPQMDSGTKKFQQFQKDVRKGFDTEVKVKFADTGATGIRGMRKQVSDALAAGGGIKVPFAAEMTQRQGQDVRKSLQDAITKATTKTPVKVVVGWIFGEGPKDPPVFRKKVLVDWDWGDGPTGGPGGARTGTRRGSGGGSSPAGGGAASRAETDEERERTRTAAESIRYHRWRRSDTARRATNARAGATDPGTGSRSQANQQAERQRQQAEREEATTATQAAQASTRRNRSQAQQASRSGTSAGADWRAGYKGTVHNCPEPGCRYGGTSEASLATHLASGHHKRGRQQPPPAASAAPPSSPTPPRAPTPGGQGWRASYKGTIYNCPEPGCRYGGTSEANLQAHLASGHHKTRTPAAAAPAASAPEAPLSLSLPRDTMRVGGSKSTDASARPAAPASSATPAAGDRATYPCTEPGCRHTPFLTQNGLTNHQKSHAQQRTAAAPVSRPAVASTWTPPPNPLGLPVASVAMMPRRNIPASPVKVAATKGTASPKVANEKCEECNAVFSSASGLAGHMESIHGSKKVGRRFVKGSNAGRTKVKCDECGRNTYDLAAHKFKNHGISGQGDATATGTATADTGIPPMPEDQSVESLSAHVAELKVLFDQTMKEREALREATKARSAGREGTAQEVKGKTSRRKNYRVSSMPRGLRRGGKSSAPGPGDPNAPKDNDLQSIATRLAKGREDLAAARDREAAEQKAFVDNLFASYGTYKEGIWTPKEGAPDLTDPKALTEFFNSLSKPSRRAFGKSLGAWTAGTDPSGRGKIRSVIPGEDASPETRAAAESGELVSAFMGIVARRAQKDIGGGAYSGVRRAGLRGRRGEGKSLGGEAVAVPKDKSFFKACPECGSTSSNGGDCKDPWHSAYGKKPRVKSVRVNKTKAERAAEKEARDALKAAKEKEEAERLAKEEQERNTVQLSGADDTRVPFAGLPTTKTVPKPKFNPETKTMDWVDTEVPRTPAERVLGTKDEYVAQATRRGARQFTTKNSSRGTFTVGKGKYAKTFASKEAALKYLRDSAELAYPELVRRFEALPGPEAMPEGPAQPLRSIHQITRDDTYNTPSRRHPLDRKRRKWKPQQSLGTTKSRVSLTGSNQPGRLRYVGAPLTPDIPFSRLPVPEFVEPEPLPEFAISPKQEVTHLIPPGVANPVEPPPTIVPISRPRQAQAAAIDPDVAQSLHANAAPRTRVPYARAVPLPVIGSVAFRPSWRDKMPEGSLGSRVGLGVTGIPVAGGVFSEALPWTGGKSRRERIASKRNRIASRKSDPIAEIGPESDELPGLNIPDAVEKLRSKFRPMAEGGSLLERLAKAGNQSSIDLLRDRPVQQDQPERAKEPFEPAWMRRAREGKGVVKDMTRHAEGDVADELPDRYFRGRSSTVDPRRESYKGEFGPGLYLTPYRTMARTFGDMSRSRDRTWTDNGWSGKMGSLAIDEYLLTNKAGILNLGRGNRIPRNILRQYVEFLADKKKTGGYIKPTSWDEWKEMLADPETRSGQQAASALHRLHESGRFGGGGGQGFPRDVIEPFGGMFQKIASEHGYGGIAGHGLDMEDEGGKLFRKGPNNLVIFPGLTDQFLRPMAEGGAFKHNGILHSATPKSVTIVGERGPEAYVEGQDGRKEIVPNQKLSSFMGSIGAHADAGVPKARLSAWGHYGEEPTGLAAINAQRNLAAQHETLKAESNFLLPPWATPEPPKSGYASSNLNAARTPEVLPMDAGVESRIASLRNNPLPYTRMADARRGAASQQQDKDAKTREQSLMLGRDKIEIRTAEITVEKADYKDIDLPTFMRRATGAGAPGAAPGMPGATPGTPGAGVPGATPGAAPNGPAIGNPAQAQAAGNVAQNAQAAPAGQGVQPPPTAVPDLMKLNKQVEMFDVRASKLGTKTDFEDTQAKIQYAKQMTPARAFTTQVAQIFEQIAGRSGIQTRARAAESATSVAIQLENQRKDAVSQLEIAQKDYKRLSDYQAAGGLLGKSDRRRMAQLQQVDIPTATTNVQETTARAGAAKAESDRAANDILRTGDVAKNVAVGFIGLAGATVAMKAAFTVLNVALETGGQAMADWSEMQLGYVNKASALNTSLGAATLQQDGNTKMVVANTLAMSGMSKTMSDIISPVLESRAAAIAGNQAAQTRSEQMAAGFGVGDDGLKLGPLAINARPKGLAEEFDKNLFASVGGLMNWGIGPGSTAPQAQTMQQNLGTFREEGKPGMATPFGGFTGFIHQLTTGQSPFAADAEKMAESLKHTTAYLGEMNEKAKEAGFALEATKASGENAADAIEKTAKAFDNLHPGLAGEIRASGIAINGGNLSEYQAAQYVQAQNTFTPSADELAKAQERGMFAQQRELRRQRGIGLQMDIPAMQAFQLMAQPLLPYGAQNLPGGGAAGNIPNKNLLKGVVSDKSYNAQVSAYSKAFSPDTEMGNKALQSQKALTAEMEKGKEVLRAWGVPETMISQISTLGTDIQKITRGLEQRSLNLTTAQYTNQIRLASRAWGDAKDMAAAVAGHTKQTVGGLEGQNLLLGRQSQLLGFMLEQRQINYKMALAGFTAPGDTPEERQARIEYAKKEADYAQKQLNIQKQMGSNQYKVANLQIFRSMTDAQAEVSLLKEARSIAIDTAAKSEQIKAMTAEQALLLQQAQEYAKEGRGIVEMYDKSTLEIEARTGKAYDKWMKKVIAGYTDAGKAFGDGIREALVLPPGTSSKGDGKSDYGRGRGTNGPETAPKTVTPKTAAGRREVEDNTDYNANGVIGAANGFLGNVSRPTKFTVGEVANETVAVLRNPRSASMAGMGGGGGGGTVNVNININGGGDIDAKKLQEWGAQIQRATLAALDRKTSLLGLRQP